MYSQASYGFDLILENTENGCQCRLIDSPAGTGQATFVVPLNEQALRKLWAELGRREEAIPPLDIGESLQQIGEQLFDALFYGEILDCFRASQEKAYHARSVLRVHVDVTRTPQLARLPWEYLFDSMRQEYLNLSVHSPVVRYTNLMHKVLPLEMNRPLRVLVAIAGPSGYPPIAVEREWLGLLDTVDFLGAEGNLVLERLQKPTLLDLQRRLRQNEYHILHFIGHCITDGITQDGQLVLEDEMGRGRPVNGQHLGALLRDHYSLRMMWISSPGDVADRGFSGEGGQSANLQVAQEMVRRGVGAVISPQFPIEHARMLTFVREFYVALGNMRPVDIAVTEARRKLYEEYGGIDWGSPVLFTRVGDGQLYDDGTVAQAGLSDYVTSRIAARLNSLRIRTAGRDTIMGWGDELSGKSVPGKR